MGRRSCLEQAELWRQRSVLCVMNSGWLHSEHARKTLKGDRENMVSFLESILSLKAHDNRGIVMQRSAKTKALPGLHWRGMLGAWEASLLKAKVSRSHSFLVRQPKRKWVFFWGVAFLFVFKEIWGRTLQDMSCCIMPNTSVYNYCV